MFDLWKECSQDVSDGESDSTVESEAFDPVDDKFADIADFDDLAETFNLARDKVMWDRY